MVACEFLEVPPAKKGQSEVKPVPTSIEFKALPAVSILCVHDAFLETLN